MPLASNGSRRVPFWNSCLMVMRFLANTSINSYFVFRLISIFYDNSDRTCAVANNNLNTYKTTYVQIDFAVSACGATITFKYLHESHNDHRFSPANNGLQWSISGAPSRKLPTMTNYSTWALPATRNVRSSYAIQLTRIYLQVMAKHLWLHYGYTYLEFS